MPDPEYYYYYYYESDVWDDEACDVNNHADTNPKYIFGQTTIANNGKHVSFLSENDYSDDSTYSKVGPYNIYQIEREINILTKDLYQIMMEINSCSNSNYYNSNGVYIPNSGGKTNCGNYKHLKDIRTWDLISSYTQFVPNNGNKTLCQRYHDLKNLVSNFNLILTSKIAPITTPATPILDQVANNSNLRDEIEKKLDNIYANPDSRELDSVRMLDSTVYTSVLWTVLATSVIFFMFKKM